MGFSAYVYCSCFQHGKTTSPPPHPEYMRMECGQLFLDVTALYANDPERAHAMEADFNHWQATACAHAGMEIAWDSVANMMGMWNFKELIRVLGVERFPTLSRELPRNNGGWVSPEVLPAFLAEVEQLFLPQWREQQTVLRESASQTELRSTIEGGETVLGFARHWLYTLDNDGFCICQCGDPLAEPRHYVFMSKHFYQKRQPDGQIVYVDADTQRESPAVEFDLVRNSPDNVECQVFSESRSIAEQYGYILHPLRKLARIAAENNAGLSWG